MYLIVEMKKDNVTLLKNNNLTEIKESELTGAKAKLGSKVEQENGQWVVKEPTKAGLYCYVSPKDAKKFLKNVDLRD